ncbi:MAG: hypothetical protein ACJ763_13955 [Bdellovibrionia bacterium]
MKLTATLPALLALTTGMPMAAFSATLLERGPSGIAVAQPQLHLELSASSQDDADLGWSCGSCTEGIEKPSGQGSLVKRFVRYDSLFESMINNATHHGTGGYNLRFKLFF